VTARALAPPRVSERPPTERPRERLATLGPAALSDAELLALLIRTGSARSGVLDVAARLLAAIGGLGAIARLTTAELAALPGLGPATAA